MTETLARQNRDLKYRVYGGIEVIANKKKWDGNMMIMGYETHTKRCRRTDEIYLNEFYKAASIPEPKMKIIGF